MKIIVCILNTDGRLSKVLKAYFCLEGICLGNISKSMIIYKARHVKLVEMLDGICLVRLSNSCIMLLRRREKDANCSVIMFFSFIQLVIEIAENKILSGGRFFI